MRSRIVFGGLAIIGAVVLWVIGLGLFQPEAESVAAGVTNIYWPMDLRHPAIFLAMAGLVLLAKGRMHANLIALLAVVTWGAVDIIFDRADVDLFSAGILGTAVLGILGTAAFYLTQKGTERPGNQIRLYYWAVFCAVAAAFMMHLQTPARVVPAEVAIAGAAISILFLITASALAAEASGNVQIGRLVTVAIVLSAIAGTVVYQRYLHGEPYDMEEYLLAAGLPGVASMAGVIWLAGRMPRTFGRWAGLIVIVLFGLPVLGYMAAIASYLGSMVVGPLLSEAAGHPQTGFAGDYFLLGLAAVGTGLAIAMLFLAVNRGNPADETRGMAAPAQWEVEDQRL